MTEEEVRNEDKDRISDLPTGALGSIVSRLCIKDALKTSVLSQRWRYLWTEQSRLEFDSTNILSIDREICRSRAKSQDLEKDLFEFVSRVDYIMRLYDGKRITSLKIDFFLDRGCSTYLDKWISRAIVSGVEKIDLLLDPAPRLRKHVEGNFGTDDNKYVFPHWLLSSASGNIRMLMHLYLQECVMKAPGDFGGFKYLRTLMLQKVILNKDFVANLFFNCLQLEDLTLIRCKAGSSLRVIGDQSLRLMHLKVVSCSPLPRVEIFARNLTTFEYSGDMEKIGPFDAPRLKKMLFVEHCEVDIPHALRKLSNFTQLEILLLTIRKVDMFQISSGTFQNLRQLSLFIYPSSLINRRSWVSSILKAAPLLQRLYLGFIANNHLEYRQGTKDECGVVHDHLKEFEMQGCIGNWFEIKLAQFVLRTAGNLERIIISPYLKYYMEGKFVDLQRMEVDGPSWEKSMKYLVRRQLRKCIPPSVQFVIL